MGHSYLPEPKPLRGFIYYMIYKLNIILYYKILQFKHFIDGIPINHQFSRYFASMEYIRRRYNLMVNVSKFTSNKKILSKIVVVQRTVRLMGSLSNWNHNLFIIVGI